jgi:hypothetical protein
VVNIKYSMAIFLKRIKNLIFLALAISTGNISAQETWAKVLPGIGSFSSPRVADLNNDSVGDIILGAGRLEFQECDSAVVALDGKTGEMLWKVSAKDQIFARLPLKILRMTESQMSSLMAAQQS